MSHQLQCCLQNTNTNNDNPSPLSRDNPSAVSFEQTLESPNTNQLLHEDPFLCHNGDPLSVPLPLSTENLSSTNPFLPNYVLPRQPSLQPEVHDPFEPYPPFLSTISTWNSHMSTPESPLLSSGPTSPLYDQTPPLYNNISLTNPISPSLSPPLSPSFQYTGASKTRFSMAKEMKILRQTKKWQEATKDKPPIRKSRKPKVKKS